MGKTTREIVLVKKNIRLQEWSRQIEEQKSSGLNVQDWCTQNGVNPKTYYYHLRKIRECCLESKPAIVPVAVPRPNSDIRIEKNGLQISLPADISADTLLALINELC